MHREKREDSKRHNQTIFHCLCLTKWNCTGCIENKWNWTTGHIENLDRNTSTPFDLPLPSSSLQRSIRIGGKKKPQNDKPEINIEVHFLLLLNEMKRNVKNDEKKWKAKLNQRLYNQRTVRPLKQREEIKSISTPGCFFSNPVASHLMILINSTSTALWISSNVKLFDFESQH